MKAFSLRVIALASLPAFGACADVASPTQEPQGLKIAVAPLQLTGIGDACYNILVENNAGGTTDNTDPQNPIYTPLPFSQTGASAGDGNDVVRLVAANGAICSSLYGNGTGGDITYIAPCDASSDTDSVKPNVQNSVTIWPFLKDGSGTVLTDWRNPCDTTPGGLVEGCQLHFDCKENADTLVEFNFTIMRNAQQGFFDVAVNFEDIFCSAKLDSCYGNGTTTTCNASPSDITLLHSADGTARQHTAVAAFACTAGAGKATDLVMGTPTVTCTHATDGNFSFPIPVNLPAGGGNGVVTTGGKTLRYAVYTGSESLQCQVGETTTTCGKEYMNFAINLGHLQGQGLTCTLGQYVATAVERSDTLDFSAAFSSYPFVQVGGAGGVALTTATTTASFTYPLNVSGSAVTTSYRDEEPSLVHRWNGTTVTTY